MSVTGASIVRGVPKAKRITVIADTTEIAKGKVVKITGHVGTIPKVTVTGSSADKPLGVTYEVIEANKKGLVIIDDAIVDIASTTADVAIGSWVAPAAAGAIAAVAQGSGVTYVVGFSISPAPGSGGGTLQIVLSLGILGGTG